MSGLPEAVRKKQEEADRKIAELQNPKDPGAAAAPEQPKDQPKDVLPPAEVQPAETQTEQPKQKEKEQPEPQDDARALQARYATLSGKYNAEVPRLQADLRASGEMNQRLTAQLDALRQQIAAMQAAPQPPAQPRQLAKPEEVETYGDVVKVTERIATQAANEASQNAVNQVKGQLQTEISDMRRTAMFTTLDGLVPNWRETNDDALFKSWCGEADPLSGRLRQQFLDDALAAYDANRVANFFRMFEESMKSQAAPASAGTQHKPPSLASQVMPQKRGPESATPVAGKKMFKASEIKAISESIARGEYRGRPQELQKVLNEIDLAMAENRVQLNA